MNRRGWFFLSVALAIAVVYLAWSYSESGRWEIVQISQPGNLEKFLLLDTRTGEIFRCDLTACAARSLQDVP